MSSNEAHQLFIIRLLNWLLVVVVLAFAAASYYVSMLEAERQHTHDTFSPYEVASAVGQTVTEFFRFEHEFALYAGADSVITLDEVRLRLDIIMSRLHQFERDVDHVGEDRLVVLFMETDPAHGVMMATLRAALEEADFALNSSDTPNMEMVQEAVRKLHAMDSEIASFAAQASSFSATRYLQDKQELASINRFADILRILLIACGAMLVGVMAAKLRVLDRMQIKLHDLTGKLTRAMDDLTIQNTRFDAALNNMSYALSMFDKDGRLAVFNDPFVTLTGIDRERLPGMSASDLRKHARGQYPRLVDHLQPHIDRGEAHAGISALDRNRSFALNAFPLPNGGWLATYADISALRAAEQRVAHMALHDALTDLPNRLYFRRRVEEMMAAASDTDASITFYFLDFDKFKHINDTLGHQVGDDLLRAVANRMQASIPEGYFISRFGGDEFAILASYSKETDHHSFSGWIIDQLSRPYHIDGRELRVGVSIGVANWAKSDHFSSEELTRRADIALYQAKADGRGCARFYVPQFDENRLRLAQLEQDLALALENGEMSIVFQPIVDTISGTPVSYEALARWNHPDFGAVSPSTFVSLAESNHAIFALGEWVLLQACTEAAKWTDEVTVSVNVSPVQFKDPAFVYKIADVLQRAGLSPSRLVLEITETAFLAASETTLAMLKRLKKMGVKFAMDDFGTGYSSLHSLLSFPFDKIKIDQTFIRALPSSSEATAVVDLVIQMTKKLDMKTTAEGVETAEQLMCMTKLLCPEVQGFLVSPPAPINDLPTDLRPQPRSKQPSQLLRALS